MLKKLLITFSVLFHISTFGQLPDGSIAPDFTLTDYYGTEHNLYTYLDAGKTVILEVFATHCPTCWNYHQTNRLKNLYNIYGPDGTNELVVLALEHDQWNDHNAFIGDGPTWITQGNWLEGTPYPIFDVEDPDRGVFADYNVFGYPLIFSICPDRILERIYTSETEDDVYAKVQACQAALSVSDNSDIGEIYFNSLTGNLIIDQYQKVTSIRITTITGQVLQTIRNIGSSAIPVDRFSPGIYLFEVQSLHARVVKKFYLDQDRR